MSEMAAAQMGIDTRGWDETMYRRGIPWERDLSVPSSLSTMTTPQTLMSSSPPPPVTSPLLLHLLLLPGERREWWTGCTTQAPRVSPSVHREQGARVAHGPGRRRLAGGRTGAAVQRTVGSTHRRPQRSGTAWA